MIDEKPKRLLRYCGRVASKPLSLWAGKKKRDMVSVRATKLARNQQESSAHMIPIIKVMYKAAASRGLLPAIKNRLSTSFWRAQTFVG